jgi:Glyoxalase-like domain
LTGVPVRWLTVFLDFPADSFGAGVAFWREVTGSGLSPLRGAAGEFATLLPTDGDAYLRVQRIFWSALTGWEGQGGGRSALPVRLELRRAGLDDRVTGHLAFACADRQALAARHAAAGARILAVLPRETEMADPAGRRYRLIEW